jgi:hypothetical protein
MGAILMDWAVRLAHRRQIFIKGPDDALPKLTETHFVSFGSDPDDHSENIAESPTDLRAHLFSTAADAGLPAAIVQNLHADDVDACAGLPMATLRDYLRAQEFGRMMDRGIPPPGYTKAVACSGCGPVLLWPTSPDRVIACPWCFRRKAGKTIPRPGENPP